jgi:imidazole glycerol-phosphate synthase subunit HisH
VITLVDYSLGNLFSVQRSLAYLGLDSVISGDPDVIAAADRLILPGVGAFRDAARLLDMRGLGDAVRRRAHDGVPLLGICLGMQLLFERSFEDGVYTGLGLLKGDIRSIREDLAVPLKVPHIGWNALHIVRETPLTRSVREGDHVYYVHSYYAASCDGSVTAASEYGLSIPGIVEQGNVYGCQFHPEKSGGVGLGFLKAFAEVRA